MIVVACSGFPVPVSRYWRELRSVEISDTDHGLPGEGSVRRWQREAPKGFVFSLVAPKAVAESGFRKTKENLAIVADTGALARALRARAVVFSADESFSPGKASRTALRTLLGALPDAMPTVVFDLPAWPFDEIAEAIGKDDAVGAFDPFREKRTPPKGSKLLYVRLPGPAGHRSRYDEAAIETIAAVCEQSPAADTICVFRNIDMHANAMQLRKRLGD